MQWIGDMVADPRQVEANDGVFEGSNWVSSLIHMTLDDSLGKSYIYGEKRGLHRSYLGTMG